VLLDDAPDREPWLFTLQERRDASGAWRRDGRMEALEIQDSHTIVLEGEAYVSYPPPSNRTQALRGSCGGSPRAPVLSKAQSRDVHAAGGALAATFTVDKSRLVIPFHVRYGDHYRLFLYLLGDSTPTWFRARLDGREVSLVFEMDAEGPTGRASQRLRLEPGRHELHIQSADAARRSVCIDKVLLVPR
jgi:hypothetical protein